MPGAAPAGIAGPAPATSRAGGPLDAGPRTEDGSRFGSDRSDGGRRHAAMDATRPVRPLPAAGPRKAYDGSWSWGQVSLTADQVRVADDAYDRFRTAEGRNLFGTYGGDGLTTAMHRIADDLEHGTLAPNTTQIALLDPDTFRARFADMLRRYPDRSADRLARRIPGAISYSFIFAADRYSAGTWIVQDALTAAGFQLLARRNDWNSSANRCVATMWHDPVNDLPFQVQFHTTESLEAQQFARDSADLVSDPRLPSEEIAQLRSDIDATWAALRVPPGNAQIGDYRREAGGTARANSGSDRPRYGQPPDRNIP